jgi:predicted  nucleic acid-binding Zn-ribbon protein
MRSWRNKNRIVPTHETGAPEENITSLMQTKNAQIAALLCEVEAKSIDIRAVKSENIHLREAFQGKDSRIARLKQTVATQEAENRDLRMRLTHEFKTQKSDALGLVVEMAELKIMELEKELKGMMHVAPCSWCQMNRDITVYSFIGQTCGCAVCTDCLIKRGPHIHAGTCKTCNEFVMSVGEFRFIYK